MLVPVEETREGQEQGGAPSFVNNLIRESGAELFFPPFRDSFSRNSFLVPIRGKFLIDNNRAG